MAYDFSGLTDFLARSGFLSGRQAATRPTGFTSGFRSPASSTGQFEDYLTSDKYTRENSDSLGRLGQGFNVAGSGGSPMTRDQANPMAESFASRGFNVADVAGRATIAPTGASTTPAPRPTGFSSFNTMNNRQGQIAEFTPGQRSASIKSWLDNQERETAEDNKLPRFGADAQGFRPQSPMTPEQREEAESLLMKRGWAPPAGFANQNVAHPTNFGGNSAPSPARQMDASGFYT